MFAEWVAEERVTLFTTDGLLQIGGSLVPRRISSEVPHLSLLNYMIKHSFLLHSVLLSCFLLCRKIDLVVQ